MKIKSILVALGVAALAFDASAYYKVSKDMKERGNNEADRPFSYVESSVNPLEDDAANRPGSKWTCRSYTGASEAQTIVYLTKNESGEIIKEAINSNSNAGGSNRKNTAFSQDANGHWCIASTASAGTYRFRYSFATDKRPIGRGLSELKIKVIAASADASEAPRINVKACLGPSTFDGNDGAGKVYHWAQLDFPQPANDAAAVQELVASADDMYNDPEALFTQRVKLVDILFENVKKGDKLAIVGFEGVLDNENDPSFLFKIPTIHSGKSETPNYTTFPGSDVPSYNVIHIQAEDFDESWVNNRVAHSPISGTPDTAQRRFEDDHNVGFASSGGSFSHFGATYPSSSVWGDDFGASMPDRYYVNPQNGLVANMHRHDDWSAYKGEYLDETSNKVSMEQAMDNFGAWLEYTFDAEEDLNLDVSFRTACHWDPFQIIKTNGSASYGKPREEGGFEVEGLEGGYLQQYSHALRLYIDGYPVRTNWDVYPKYEPGMTEAEFIELASTPQKWTNYQEEDAYGNKVNSYVLHLFPNPGNMSSWDPYEKWQMVKLRAADPNVPQGEVSARTVTAPTSYIRPDFADITVPKGRHTLKVQSLGGQWMFDDMKLVGKPKTWDTPTGVDTVGADSEDDAAEDAPVEVYNLQGIRMAGEDGLAPGIYVKRSGKRVEKFVVR